MKNTRQVTRQIFISYKREEVEHAQRLRDCLTELGYEIWWDRNIQCGEAWNEVLDKAVREAGCIIVLWSPRGLQSRWVMHEASSAMERGIYTPARIEICNIDQPYNRFQATDLMDWKGDVKHPGLQRLILRINKLLPPKKNAAERAMRWVKVNLALLAGVLVAISALSILAWQTYSTQRQIESLDHLVSRVSTLDSSFTTSSNALVSSMESNSKRTDGISENLDATSGKLQDYVTTFNSFQTQMVQGVEMNKGIAKELDATSIDLKQYVKDFHDFKNEVFECWIVYNIDFSMLTVSPNGQLHPVYDLGVVIKDTVLEKTFTKTPGDYSVRPAQTDIPYYNYLAKRDIKTIDLRLADNDTIYGLGVIGDFDLGKFDYQRHLLKDTITENTTVTIKRSIPLEQLIYHLKGYATFDDFNGSTFHLTGLTQEMFPFLGGVTVYLVGRDKMKVLRFHRYDFGEYWGIVKPKTAAEGWSLFGIELTISDTLYRNSLFTQRQNILLIN